MQASDLSDGEDDSLDLQQIASNNNCHNIESIGTATALNSATLAHPALSHANGTSETGANDDWNFDNTNCYLLEVNKAIYGDTTGHPPHGSSEYFQLAHEYALYGTDFLDFPEDVTSLCGNNINTSQDITSLAPGYGNGQPTILPTPESAVLMGLANLVMQSPASSIATFPYYQTCNGIVPTVCPITAGMCGYGSYVPRVAARTHFGNVRHAISTTNFIPNRFLNAALGSPPALLLANPMLATVTQQYLSSFNKDAQALTAITKGVYERFVYAQILQQQAAAVGAMFYQARQRRVIHTGLPGSIPQGCV